jgi:hypothetical protein
VEGGEEWWRSGWRNRGVEGRVKGVVEEETMGGLVEWRRRGVLEEWLEKSMSIGNRDEWWDERRDPGVEGVVIGE